MPKRRKLRKLLVYKKYKFIINHKFNCSVSDAFAERYWLRSIIEARIGSTIEEGASEIARISGLLFGEYVRWKKLNNILNKFMKEFNK